MGPHDRREPKRRALRHRRRSSPYEGSEERQLYQGFVGRGHKVRPGSAVYAATKHTLRALSEGLRQEVKPHNIRTTVISPGAFATELPDTITGPEVVKRVRGLISRQGIVTERPRQTQGTALCALLRASKTPKSLAWH